MRERSGFIRLMRLSTGRVIVTGGIIPGLRYSDFCVFRILFAIRHPARSYNGRSNE